MSSFQSKYFVQITSDNELSLYQIISEEPTKIQLEGIGRSFPIPEIIKENEYWIVPNIPNVTIEFLLKEDLYQLRDHLLNLPPYLFLQIVIQIPFQDALAVCLVDSILNQKICQNDDYWRDLFYRELGEPKTIKLPDQSWKEFYFSDPLNILGNLGKYISPNYQFIRDRSGIEETTDDWEYESLGTFDKDYVIGTAQGKNRVYVYLAEEGRALDWNRNLNVNGIQYGDVIFYIEYPYDDYIFLHYRKNELIRVVLFYLAGFDYEPIDYEIINGEISRAFNVIPSREEIESKMTLFELLTPH